ncbi:ATP synthase F0 subunit B [Clostridium sp. KNHs216]|uniref:ATP synthase F0 subunit B n=1 Tax=Clostridium sp. KNHs216 TaxID=1550235 RepID=UPI001152D1E5|nr:ATP synthase F0 subunit B [Clostridium sp. KNHs216]TQI67868.1 F-type H+-transporting ATPase subunit b [Clostridium sp. KNHs216]
MKLDLSEMVWTIINFLLLMFLLKIFLYTPLLKFMDAQKARIDEGIAEGEKAGQAKEENAKQLAENLQKSSIEARRILSESRAADERTKAVILNRANESAASMRNSANRRIAEEEEAARKDVGKSLPELVSVLTFHLLGEAKPAG